MPWTAGPPPPFHHGVSRVEESDRDWLRAEVARCTATGAWTPATDRRFVSRAFVVRQSNGKRRLVIDLRHLNSFCPPASCRFEALTMLRRLARKGAWMVSLDITDAYHHLSIHEEDQRYFTFALELSPGETVYLSSSALNFGWSHSPLVFTQLMRPVTAALRNPIANTPVRFGEKQATPATGGKVKSISWLDDFLFLLNDQTEAEAKVATSRIVATFEGLGFVIAYDKSTLRPTKFMQEHLGFAIDSERGLFLLTPRREKKVAAAATDLLCRAARHQRWVAKRRLARFAGLAQSCSLAVPMSRCWLRSIYDDVSSVRGGWAGRVRLSRQSMDDLREWAAIQSNAHLGRAIWRRPETATLSTDASDHGHGAQLGGHPSVIGSSRMAPAAGFWDAADFRQHITFKELKAVRLWVRIFAPQLAGRRVLLHCDNQAVVAILTNLVSKSALLMREVRLLIQVLDWWDIALRPRYIRSSANVAADLMSRLAAAGDYRVEYSILAKAQATFGVSCTVDAFASAATAMLPRYWTAEHDASANGEDAFAQCWAAEALWCHPPVAMLPRTAQMLAATPDCEALVVTPHWPDRSWHAELAALASSYVTYPSGSLVPVVADAPPCRRWPITVFHVPRRA